MLIIFDCDGVLVDSEGLAAEVFSQVLAKYNLTMNSEQCFAEFVGLSLPDCYARIQQRFSLACMPEGFHAELMAQTQRYFSIHLKPIAKIERVLELLRINDIPCCVASNGALEKTQNSLNTTGLAKYFSGRYFSSDQVASGKPAPDLFIKAALEMGVDMSDCIVVEDSSAGVSAALAANMRVIHLLHHQKPLHPTSDSYFPVMSVDELKVRLESLIVSVTLQ